jgi:nucleoside-diphosphate-sugar epimerase
MEFCLVTGATGFIGRVLCQRLRERGVRVRAMARQFSPGPWDDFVAADLGESDLTVDILDGIDTVFHLAGKAHSLSEVAERESEYRRINIGGMEALLAIAERSSLSRFVFFSSVKAMGDDGGDCMDEEWAAAPTTPYGISKLESERLLFAFGRNSGVHVSTLRLPLVYGRGVKGNLWKMMDAIDRGRFPPLPEIKNKRSLVHVDDVISAAILAANSARANGKIYIVTDGHPYSTDEIYGMMRDALGKSARDWRMPLAMLRVAAGAGDVIGRLRGRRFVFDSDAYRKLLGSAWYSSEKIEQELGFRPSRGLHDGVEEMVRGFKEPGTGVGASR